MRPWGRPQHAIDELVLDLSFSSRRLAQQEEPELIHWLSNELLPALNQVFDHYSPEPQLLRFDTLSFDFGKLPAQDYRAHIQQKLLEQLVALITPRLLPVAARAAKPGGASSDASTTSHYPDMPEADIRWLFAADNKSSSASANIEAMTAGATGDDQALRPPTMQKTSAPDPTSEPAPAQQTPTEQTPAEQSQRRQAALAWLNHYLQTGQLPDPGFRQRQALRGELTTAKSSAQPPHHLLLEQLLTDTAATSALNQLLQQQPQRALLIQRLLNQFTQAHWQALVIGLTPEAQAALALLQTWQNLQLQQPSLAPQWQARQAWGQLLQQVITQPASREQTLLTQVWEHISAHSPLPQHRIAQQLLSHQFATHQFATHQQSANPGLQQFLNRHNQNQSPDAREQENDIRQEKDIKQEKESEREKASEKKNEREQTEHLNKLGSEQNVDRLPGSHPANSNSVNYQQDSDKACAANVTLTHEQTPQPTGFSSQDAEISNPAKTAASANLQANTEVAAQTLASALLSSRHQTLEALWDKYRGPQTPLLRQLLNQYLPSAELRQRLALNLPLPLLADMLLILAPQLGPLLPLLPELASSIQHSSDTDPDLLQRQLWALSIGMLLPTNAAFSSAHTFVETIKPNPGPDQKATANLAQLIQLLKQQEQSSAQQLGELILGRGHQVSTAPQQTKTDLPNIDQTKATTKDTSSSHTQPADLPPETLRNTSPYPSNRFVSGQQDAESETSLNVEPRATQRAANQNPDLNALGSAENEHVEPVVSAAIATQLSKPSGHSTRPTETLAEALISGNLERFYQLWQTQIASEPQKLQALLREYLPSPELRQRLALAMPQAWLKHSLALLTQALAPSLAPLLVEWFERVCGPLQTSAEAFENSQDQSEAVQTNAIQTETLQTEAFQTNTIYTEALQAKTILTEPSQSETIHAGITQNQESRSTSAKDQWRQLWAITLGWLVETANSPGNSRTGSNSHSKSDLIKPSPSHQNGSAQPGANQDSNSAGDFLADTSLEALMQNLSERYAAIYHQQPELIWGSWQQLWRAQNSSSGAQHLSQEPFAQEKGPETNAVSIAIGKANLSSSLESSTRSINPDPQPAFSDNSVSISSDPVAQTKRQQADEKTLAASLIRRDYSGFYAQWQAALPLQTPQLRELLLHYLPSPELRQALAINMPNTWHQEALALLSSELSPELAPLLMQLQNSLTTHHFFEPLAQFTTDARLQFDSAQGGDTSEQLSQAQRHLWALMVSLILPALEKNTEPLEAQQNTQPPASQSLTVQAHSAESQSPAVGVEQDQNEIEEGVSRASENFDLRGKPTEKQNNKQTENQNDKQLDRLVQQLSSAFARAYQLDEQALWELWQPLIPTKQAAREPHQPGTPFTDNQSSHEIALKEAADSIQLATLAATQVNQAQLVSPEAIEATSESGASVTAPEVLIETQLIANQSVSSKEHTSTNQNNPSSSLALFDLCMRLKSQQQPWQALPDDPQLLAQLVASYVRYSPLFADEFRREFSQAVRSHEPTSGNLLGYYRPLLRSLLEETLVDLEALQTSANLQRVHPAASPHTHTHTNNNEFLTEPAAVNSNDMPEEKNHLATADKQPAQTTTSTAARQYQDPPPEQHTISPAQDLVIANQVSIQPKQTQPRQTQTKQTQTRQMQKTDQLLPGDKAVPAESASINTQAPAATLGKPLDNLSGNPSDSPGVPDQTMNSLTNSHPDMKVELSLEMLFQQNTPKSQSEALEQTDSAHQRELVKAVTQITDADFHKALQIQIQQLLQHPNAPRREQWQQLLSSAPARQRLIASVPGYMLHRIAQQLGDNHYPALAQLVQSVLESLALLEPQVKQQSDSGIQQAIKQAHWEWVLARLFGASRTPQQVEQVLLNSEQREKHQQSLVESLAQAASLPDSYRLLRLVKQRLAATADRVPLTPPETETSPGNTRPAQATKLQSRALNPAFSLNDKTPAQKDDTPWQDALPLNNVGQVLAAPFMPRLFSMLKLTVDGQFVHPMAADRAAHLLQFMVDGQTQAPEYELTLNKVLCGISTSLPLTPGIDITAQERETIEQMLGAMIQHWSVLGATSIAGLRETFFQRQGWLLLDEDYWRLQVQEQSFDLLLDRLPWSIAMIKHSWMDKPLRVNWRNIS